MLRDLIRQRDRKERPLAIEPTKVMSISERPAVETGDMTAIELVNQAAERIQSIEYHAAETLARAHDLGRRAAEQLQLAESRIRDMEAAQGAMQGNLNAANARAHQAEQLVSQMEAEIAAVAERVSSADQRARFADARAVEAERMLIRVEDAIQSQLLGKRQTSMNRMAAAA